MVNKKTATIMVAVFVYGPLNYIRAYVPSGIIGAGAGAGSGAFC